jgi:hypothetical protein
MLSSPSAFRSPARPLRALALLALALLAVLPLATGCDSNDDDDPEPLEGRYEIERFEFVPTAPQPSLRFDLLSDTLDTTDGAPTIEFDSERVLLDFAIETEDGSQDALLVGEFERTGSRVRIDFSGEPGDRRSLLPLPSAFSLTLTDGEATLGTTEGQRIELDGDVITSYAEERYVGIDGIAGRLEIRAVRTGS